MKVGSSMYFQLWIFYFEHVHSIFVQADSLCPFLDWCEIGLFVLPSAVSCSAHRVVSLSVVFISLVPSQCFVFDCCHTFVRHMCLFLSCSCLFRLLVSPSIRPSIHTNYYYQLFSWIEVILTFPVACSPFMLIISVLFFFSSFSMDLLCWILFVFFMQGWMCHWVTVPSNCDPWFIAASCAILCIMP